MANLIPWRRKKSDVIESFCEGANLFPDWFFEESLFPQTKEHQGRTIKIEG